MLPMGLLANGNDSSRYGHQGELSQDNKDELFWTGAYLPQVDAHDHPQLCIRHQGADWTLTGKLYDPDLQKKKQVRASDFFFF